MKVVAYAEHREGRFGKPAFESISYAHKIAELCEGSLTVVAIGPIQEEELRGLGKYGAEKVLHNASLTGFDCAAYASAIARVASSEDAAIVILPGSFSGKGLAPRIAIKLNSALIGDVTELASIEGQELKVRRNAFSGKATALMSAPLPGCVLTLAPNSFTPVIKENSVELGTFELPEEKVPAMQVKESIVESGKVPLANAELVVSGGRGLKGPENWSMLEELAGLLGAATACSKPVSDAGWRPHSEHVGQTGITIAPNLYIAVGISGAIQHLAGVSGSRIIVVINKDPEAPFFKAADYGIVGDAFEVVPQLVEALKKRE